MKEVVSTSNWNSNSNESIKFNQIASRQCMKNCIYTHVKRMKGNGNRKTLKNHYAKCIGNNNEHSRTKAVCKNKKIRKNNNNCSAIGEPSTVVKHGAKRFKLISSKVKIDGKFNLSQNNQVLLYRVTEENKSKQMKLKKLKKIQDTKSKAI